MEGRRSRNSGADAKVEGRAWLWTLMLSMENWKSGNLICKSFDFYASFSKQVSFFFLSVHFYLVSCCHDQRSHFAAHTCVIKEAIWSIYFKHKKKKIKKEIIYLKWKDLHELFQENGALLQFKGPIVWRKGTWIVYKGRWRSNPL